MNQTEQRFFWAPSWQTQHALSTSSVHILHKKQEDHPIRVFLRATRSGRTFYLQGYSFEVSFKISSLIPETVHPSSSGSAGGREAAPAVTEETTTTAKQTKRRNRRNRTRKGKHKQNNRGSVVTDRDEYPMSEAQETIPFVDKTDLEPNETTSEAEPEKNISIKSAPEEATSDKSMNMGDHEKAREWFASLSTEEQVVALGFTDEEFLATLCRAASLSPTFSGGNLTTDGPTRKDTIDWMAAIPSGSFENGAFATRHTEEKAAGAVQISEVGYDKVAVPLNAEANGDDEQVAVASIGEIGAAEQIMNGTGNVMEDEELAASEKAEEATGQVTEDPDSFRIRANSNDDGVDRDTLVVEDQGAKQTDMESGDETPVLAEEIPSSNSVETSTIDSGRKEHILSFMNNVCTVSPSAFQLVSAPASSGNVPVVSLLPSYLSQKSGEDALLAFDELMSSGKFLSGPLFDSWNDAVQSLASGNVPTTTYSAPLYMLLLLRFQLSVLESYRNSTAASDTQPFSKTPPTEIQTAAELDQAPTLVPPENSSSRNDIDPSPGPRDENSSTGATTEGASLVTPVDSGAADKPQTSETSFESTSPTDPVTDGNNDIIALLPLLFKRLDETSKATGEEERIIMDLASLLNVSFQSPETEDFYSILKSVNERVAKRIFSLQSNEASTEEPQRADIPGEESAGEVTMAEQTPEPSDAVVIPEENADAEAFGVSVETSLNGVGSAGKKNSKKKKKKKKKKGSSNMALGAPKEEKEEEVTKQHDVEPAIEKTETSTQTEAEPPAQSIEISAEDKVDEVHPPPSNAEVSLTVSVHSERSTGDDSVDSAETSIQGHKAEEGKPGESDDGLQISRLGGVGTVVVTPSVARGSGESSTIETPTTEMNDQSTSPEEEDNHDEWETVEVKTRGNRKKSGDRGNNGRFSSMQVHGGNGSKKNKVPRTSESRRRVAKRKMIREILSSVLDAVDDQVRRKKAAGEPAPRPVPNAWGTVTTRKPSIPSGKSADVTKATRPGSQMKEGATMRDILMRKPNGGTASGTPANQQHVPQRGYPDRARPRGLAETGKKGKERPVLGSPTADQNTAPTLPETLSAVSTASAFTETPSTKNIPQTQGTERSESSSSESIEATKAQSNSKQPTKEVSPSPPLPTLLSPGNANSATSSVASSLDAPHVVHHNHHSSYPGSENDVGYHLLRVCDRLTRDIDQFMKRREESLRARRLERSLVLGSLQEILSTIWPVGCTVEMYGSCATDLDLPSSDLDLVVRGLDQAELAALQADSQNRSGSRSELDNEGRAADAEKTSSDHSESGKPTPPQKSSAAQLQFPIVYPPITSNAERVVTLATELERHPWAVHVKAIPTAKVPVIKILADPARLQAAAGDGECIMQPTQSSQSTTMETKDPSDPMERYRGPQNQMPWRGADVVNGLLKVDITFEGPEHGGIGSTKFSQRVVEEFSRETGLPADSTPAVQVIMVLKELLAQRRLNEPFSGGLSSYALLLLAISVVRERSIIRKELERVERQRKLVAAGGGNAVPLSKPNESDKTVDDPSLHRKEANQSSDSKNQGTFAKQGEKSKPTRQNGDKNAERSTPSNSQRKDVAGNRSSAGNQAAKSPSDPKSTKATGVNETATLKRGGSASSSWASIARKNSTASSQKASQDSVQSNASSENQAPVQKKMGSFADAVAKGSWTHSPNGNKGESASKRNHSKLQGTQAKDGRGANSSEEVKTDANTQARPEKSKTSSLPVNAPPYEPSNTQSYSGSVPTKQNASLMAEDSASFFPQSFHDVIEVLCSGETTSGKLLMHFLLFYGQHFDSHSIAIDYSNTHERDANANNGYAVSSPYMLRRSNGSYDPMTGMLTVDPIVVYDPLEGREAHNVARSCFAWGSIRWVFAQSYMTLSSAVEMSAGHMPTQGGVRSAQTTQGANAGHNEFYPSSGQQDAAWGMPYGHDESGNVIFDPSTPLLELLLSY